MAEPARGEARRLFIDVSVITRNDAGTGIQRVVRAVASHVIGNPPPGWQVVPVGATRKRPYHQVTWPTRTYAAGSPIESRPGDVFLGLDFALDDIHAHRGQLSRFKQSGGRIWFVMYDLLPHKRPEWFSDKLVVRYRRWLRAVAALADGFQCISPQVERDLLDVLAGRYGIKTGVNTCVMPMGWNLAAAARDTELPEGLEECMISTPDGRSILMVGTVEPRKGYSDILAAFELLWAQGSQSRLVIVGRPGWKNAALLESLRSHQEVGKRLFWFENASDLALSMLYGRCDGVIVASHAEGFGLPLIEALGHHKPVLARDLEVFRAHEACGVRYFPQNAQPAEIADHIQAWIGQAVGTPTPGPLALSSWADAAAFVLAAITMEDRL
jgi:glycosyltransferase involved in cell wall biosynthesis